MFKKKSRRNRRSWKSLPPREMLRSAAGYLWRQWIRPIAPVVLIAMTFRGAVADWNDVPTGSMRPTIIEGDRIFVNKLAYGLRVPLTSFWLAQWGGPERGEITLLFSPKDETLLVKRVVGLPGDVLAMVGNRLLINGRPLRYEPASDGLMEQLAPENWERHRVAAETLGAHRHAVMSSPGIAAPRSFGPLVIPEGHYFVMGDNRDHSADSRAFGFVARERIVGRSSRVVLSFDRENWYLPRGGRFWHKLP
jgi:signal peptidase I